MDFYDCSRLQQAAASGHGGICLEHQELSAQTESGSHWSILGGRDAYFDLRAVSVAVPDLEYLLSIALVFNFPATLLLHQQRNNDDLRIEKH